MKIAIAVLASLAFATTVNAYVPSTPVEKKPIAKIGEIELAAGSSRGLTATTRGAPSSKGAAKSDGKTMQ
ncbi:hypothetical protein N182_23915 [Sinorhizobium sp. GL2]|nr:hypothetical protein N182_23915 [Sinorhizobium sp. GL2]